MPGHYRFLSEREKSLPYHSKKAKRCIEMGWDEGAISAEERKMLSRVFTLNDKTVGEVMVPREKMTVLDVNASTYETMNAIVKTGYTRFPVKRGKNLDIIGFMHAKDLFQLAEKGGSASKKILRPPCFVADDKKVDAQLRSFQGRKLHQAVVLDKEGKVAGLITLEDILEELVGSIQDEHD